VILSYWSNACNALTTCTLQNPTPIPSPRNLKVPVDYNNPKEGTFTLYYQLNSNFDFNKPTIFFFQDSQQNYGQPGKVDDLARRYQFDESFNLVRYQHRGREDSFIEVKNNDGSINWEKAYRFLSSSQVVEDIERIRQDLFSKYPESKIYLYGRSGGGYLIQEYLAKYSDNVDRAFIRCAPNPLIMEKLDYIESKILVNSLDSIDTELKSKLKKIIDREFVPKLELLWLLQRLGYNYQNLGPIQDSIINELYDHNKETYTSYINKGGYNYSELKKNMTLIGQMGAGMFLRPLECDEKYLLGPEPDYIDPIYYCFRDLSSQVFRLIEEKIVPPPTYPPLDNLREIETEVFYLAGKSDHMSPFQIGVELGQYLKNYELFIANDNHMMIRHEDCLPMLRNAFLKFGLGSEQLQNARNSLQCKEWKPE